MLNHWLWLSTREVSNQMKLTLLEHFGTPESIYFSDREEYALVEGMKRNYFPTLEDKDLGEVDKILGDVERLGIRILTIQDAAYPSRLKNIYDPPILLYYKGMLPVFDEEAAVAVVGTRDATPYGIQATEKLSYGMASQGAMVISGLARGIDSAAHRAALRAGGKTAAVLGCGIDVIYPPENRYLYEDVAASGSLISEYPPGTPPASRHFPERNRIISGLSVAVLVVEAPEKSGALITAAAALDQGREVFAVPGQIDAPMSIGCNRLIRDGAGLASESWDILQDFWPRFAHKIRPNRVLEPEDLEYHGESVLPGEAAEVKPQLDLATSDLSLTDDQILILKTLGDEPIHVDDLVELTQIPTRRVLSALTILTMEELAEECSGKKFIARVQLV
ncbi:MAG: DNA-processing protein DprA [Oscillospiraceae bacterium]|nr:DNA-processing protein DprA [Oscillospiraceae bacterium]